VQVCLWGLPEQVASFCWGSPTSEPALPSDGLFSPGSTSASSQALTKVMALVWSTSMQPRASPGACGAVAAATRGSRPAAPGSPAPSTASGLASQAARRVRAPSVCPSPCQRSRPSVSLVLCRSLCVCSVVLFCLSLCPLSCLVGSVFQKKIVGMALTKRTVQSLPVSA